MEFEYAYRGNTAVEHRGDRTELSFSPDTKRPPTYFSGELRQNVAFREAISALHRVVVSDLRFKPKDKTAYKAWAAKQEDADLDAIFAQRQQVAGRLKGLREELAELERQSARRMGPFLEARRRYFNYLYERNKDFWFVLDPVITVHPDEAFFECFSQDESSYGRLGASYEVFQNVGEFSCGTTNIDYSSPLYDEFQKIRSYKKTRFEVDPTGFDRADGRGRRVQGSEDRLAGLVGARVPAGELGHEPAGHARHPAPHGRAQLPLRAASGTRRRRARAPCATSSSPASR